MSPIHEEFNRVQVDEVLDTWVLTSRLLYIELSTRVFRKWWRISTDNYDTVLQVIIYMIIYKECLKYGG